LSSNVSVSARVYYQSVPPYWLDEMRMFAAPEINTFLGMYDAADKAAVMLTEDTLNQVILPLSADVQNTEELQIYPNPIRLNGPVFIEFKAAITDFALYTSSGQLVNCKLMQSEGNRYKIEGIQSPGVYFIRIQSGTKLFTKKIVKSN
jgi:hypothetical protein